MRALLFRFLLAFVVLSFCPFRGLGYNMFSSEVTVIALDAYRYEAVFTFYRDCSKGGMTIGLFDFTVRNSDSSKSYSLHPQYTSIRKMENKCLAANDCTPANTNASGQGVEILILTDTIDIREQPYESLQHACKLMFEVSGCCVESGFRNGGSNEQLYGNYEVDRCRFVSNRGTGITSGLVSYGLLNQPFWTRNTFSNSDYDSLSFHFEERLSGNEKVISFTSNYSLKRPVDAYDPTGKNIINPYAATPIGFYFDSIVGDIIYTPVYSANFLLGYTIKEWKKDSSGKLFQVASSYRNFVSSVQSSNNPAPVFKTGSNFSICSGSSFCTDILIEDKPLPNQAPDSVSIKWESEIPGAQFSISSDTARQPSLHFCWTPHDSDVRSEPYIFDVFATDNHCPLPNNTGRRFSVKVVKSPSGKIISESLSCGRISVRTDSVITGTSYFWEVLNDTSGPVNPVENRATFRNGQHFSNQPVDTLEAHSDQQYIIRMLATNTFKCTSEFTDTITISGAHAFYVKSDSVYCCENGIVNLRNFENKNSTGGIWTCTNSPQSLNDTIFNPNPICADVARNYTLNYAYSTSGCDYQRDLNLHIRPRLPETLKPLSICTNANIVNPDAIGFTPNIKWKNYHYEWECLGCSSAEWDSFFSNSNNQPTFNLIPFFAPDSLNAFKKIELKLSLTDSFGCESNSHAPLTFLYPRKIDKLKWFNNNGNLMLCRGEDSLILQSDDYPAVWTLDNKVLPTPSINQNQLPDGDHFLKMASGKDCPVDSVTFGIYDSDRRNYLPNDTILISENQQKLLIQTTDTSGADFTWFGSDPNFSLATKAGFSNEITLPYNRKTYPFTSFIYVVNKQAKNCTSVSDTMFIQLDPDPCSDFQLSHLIQDNNLYVIASFTGLDEYKWYLNGDLLPNYFANELWHNKLPRNLTAGDSVRLETIYFGNSCSVNKAFEALSVNELSRDIKVFPNPAHDKLVVNGVQEFRYKIIEINGRLISEGTVNDNTLDISQLINGSYILIIENNESTYRRLFFKE
ncbi:MAG: T9SS type A sorting domain-containing protein [Bacteroidetes bacterium]|nr:T9SS type A sorting domain-containing protein [Bacteroidota bacterium]